VEDKELFEEKLVEIEALIDSQKIVELSEYIEEMHPADIAETMVELQEDKMHKLFQVLSWELAAKVLDELDSDMFSKIVSLLTSEHKKKLLELMSLDNMVDILAELSEEKRLELINLLDAEDAEDIRELLVYEEDTAGGIMTTEFVSLRKDITIYSAIEHLREHAPDAETIYYVYVVDKNNRLSGVISLRELIVARPNALVEDIMSESIIYVNINDDQEEVARVVKKYDLLAIPVTDTNGRLRGIITFDDIMDVIEEEATEDIYKFAGTMEAEAELYEEDKMSLRIFSSVKARLPWLIVTLFGGILSATILSRYEETLNSYAAVAYFMPMLTGMGGNVGTQSSTLTVRGLATGNVDAGKSLRTIFQEMSIGLCVGMVCSLLICGVAFFWMKNIKLGIVVGMSMAANMITAATIGTVVPILFKKSGIDPAVASAPFISTALDITGITIYFTLTTLILLQA